VTIEEVKEWFFIRDKELSIKINGLDTDIYFRNEITCCTISGPLERLSEGMLTLILGEIKLWASRPKTKQKSKFKERMSHNSKKKRKKK
jgi:hypothetical protein